MLSKMELVLDYRGYNALTIQPQTLLCIYPIGRQELQTLVVVYSPPGPDYQGLSVTNGAELLATEFVNNSPLRQEYAQRFGALNPGRVIWIEHYPDQPRRFGRLLESFDLVTFEWNWHLRDGEWKARLPTWHRISREVVEALIREPFPGGPDE